MIPAKLSTCRSWTKNSPIELFLSKTWTATTFTVKFSLEVDYDNGTVKHILRQFTALHSNDITTVLSIIDMGYTAILIFKPLYYCYHMFIFLVQAPLVFSKFPKNVIHFTSSHWKMPCCMKIHPAPCRTVCLRSNSPKEHNGSTPSL